MIFKDESGKIDTKKLESDFKAQRESPFSSDITPPSVKTPEKGSVFKAVFETENELAFLFKERTGRYTRRERNIDPNFQPAKHIPPDLIDYAPILASETNIDDFDDAVFSLRKELISKEIIAGAPGRAFISGVMNGFISPTMAMPGGAIYKVARSEFNIAKSAISVGAAGAAQSAVQETILQNTQASRTLEESIWNTATSALMAGTIGAAGGWFANTPVGRKAKIDSANEYSRGPQPPQEYPFGMGPKDDINPPSTDGGGNLLSLEQSYGKSAGADYYDFPGYADQSESLYGINKFFNPLFAKSPLSPTMIKMMFSEFTAAKSTAFELFENNLLQNKNVFNYTRSEQAAETFITDARKKYLSPQMEFINVYREAANIKAGFIGDIQSVFNWNNFETFSQQAGFVARRGDKSDDPHIQKAVSIFRNGVYEPIKNWMKDLGVLPEDFSTTATSDSYLPKMINSSRVVAEPERFKQIIMNGYRKIDLYLNKNRAEINNAQERISSLEKEIESVVKRSLKKSGIVDFELKDLLKLEELHKELDKYNKTRIKWDGGLKGDEISAKIKKQEAYLSAIAPEYRGLISSLLADLKKQQKYLDELVPRLYRNNDGNIPLRERDINELGELADKVMDGYLGKKEERIINPFLDNMISSGGQPFHERVVMVMDVDMEDFLINDIMDLTNRFVRGSVPYLQLLEIARTKGFETIDAWKADRKININNQYDKMTLEGKDQNGKKLSEKKRQKLFKDLKKQLNNVDKSFDMLLGIYGSGPNVQNNDAAKLYRLIKDWTTARFMGHMGIASLTELTAATLKIGPGDLLVKGFIPAIKSLSDDFKAGTITKNDLNSMGYGVQSQMGIQLKSYLDHDGLSTQPGYFQKFMDVSLGMLGKVTLSDYIQTVNETITGNAFIYKTISSIRDLVNGNIAEKDRVELASSGIDAENVKPIYDRIKKYGSIDGEDLYFNEAEWPSATNEDIDAIRTFRNAIRKQISSSVISVPGLGDRPDIMHSPLGGLIFQFKGWMFAAHNKLLLAGIQRNDRDFYMGVATQIAMGSMVYSINSLIKEGEVNTDPSIFLRNSIDYSGLTGIFGEVANIAQKAGVIPGQSVGRYKSRGILGSLIGPLAGTVEDAARLTSLVANPGEGPLSDSDLKLIKRFFPHQNNAFVTGITRAIRGDDD